MAESGEDVPETVTPTPTSFAAQNSMYETLDLMINAFNS